MMPKSLSWKLTLSFILVAFVTAALVAVFIRITSADRLSQLIIDQQRSSLETSLADYYAANGSSWGSIAVDWAQFQTQTGLTQNSPANGHFSPGGRQSNGHDPRSLFGLADQQGQVLVSFDPHYPAGSQLPADVLNAGAPVTVDSKQVGTILTTNQAPGFNPEEALFLDRTNQALIFAILGAMVLALILGLLLARTLTLPLRALTQASQGIARGELEQQVKVTSKDEIGQLANAFNRMSLEVARVNMLRKQMTADIAHDLRTPLTVIAGYIESMRDGVLAPTSERLALIYAEIERLQTMVGDLRMLSQADAGELALNPQRVSPAALLERSAALFQHKAEQQGVILCVDVPTQVPEIQVDEARVLQVLDNLLSNALRFTPAGGEICLATRAEKDALILSVKDTGSGIAPEELPFIFDRFYRAEKSRHAEAGESGLGLAIVRALVEAHGGRVWAESPPGKGATIYLEFPIIKNQA
jgi:signal transduction histidine kinase